MVEYSFSAVADDDWPWVLKGCAEAVWLGLTEKQKAELGRDALDRYYEEEIATFEPDPGIPNLAIIARGPGGERCGFVWVGKVNDDGTGREHGFVSDLFIEPAHRGAGLATELMRRAEDWCRERGLPYLQLHVAIANPVAGRFYQKLGFAPERQIMNKYL